MSRNASSGTTLDHLAPNTSLRTDPGQGLLGKIIILIAHIGATQISPVSAKCNALFNNVNDNVAGIYFNAVFLLPGTPQELSLSGRESWRVDSVSQEKVRCVRYQLPIEITGSLTGLLFSHTISGRMMTNDADDGLWCWVVFLLVAQECAAITKTWYAHAAKSTMS